MKLTTTWASHFNRESFRNHIPNLLFIASRTTKSFAANKLNEVLKHFVKILSEAWVENACFNDTLNKFLQN
ncbi:hypothetical protein THZG08_40046 [Vibrio owensii]|nr:hypothetical protein THZG08_40046 [Vibrio owensii]CAH1575399.1 hypothetical protein THOA03_40046 [Vibrio owensii]